jgi:hypothetical protein
MTDQLPTARTTHRAGLLVVLCRCKACGHQAPADLQAVINSGQGDVPLKRLKFRCAKCGSSRTDNLTMAKDAFGVPSAWARASAPGPVLRQRRQPIDRLGMHAKPLEKVRRHFTATGPPVAHSPRTDG